LNQAICSHKNCHLLSERKVFLEVPAAALEVFCIRLRASTDGQSGMSGAYLMVNIDHLGKFK
jgi:hypothetical protein